MVFLEKSIDRSIPILWSTYREQLGMLGPTEQMSLFYNLKTTEDPSSDTERFF
jgi:hypothetical protein